MKSKEKLKLSDIIQLVLTRVENVQVFDGINLEVRACKSDST